jgi:hypothetical protein
MASRLEATLTESPTATPVATLDAKPASINPEQASEQQLLGFFKLHWHFHSAPCISPALLPLHEALIFCSLHQ